MLIVDYYTLLNLCDIFWARSLFSKSVSEDILFEVEDFQLFLEEICTVALHNTVQRILLYLIGEAREVLTKHVCQYQTV